MFGYINLTRAIYAQMKARGHGVIVNDIGMPEVDGYAFIRSVRSHELRRSIPAIALTAYVRAEEAERREHVVVDPVLERLRGLCRRDVGQLGLVEQLERDAGQVQDLGAADLGRMHAHGLHYHGFALIHQGVGLRLAGRSNGVAQLHGAVSRQMFNHLWPDVPENEVPIGAITNGSLGAATARRLRAAR